MTDDLVQKSIGDDRIYPMMINDDRHLRYWWLIDDAIYNMMMMMNLQYDDDPMMNLQYDDRWLHEL